MATRQASSYDGAAAVAVGCKVVAWVTVAAGAIGGLAVAANDGAALGVVAFLAALPLALLLAAAGYSLELLIPDVDAPPRERKTMAAMVEAWRRAGSTQDQ